MALERWDLENAGLENMGWTMDRELEFIIIFEKGGKGIRRR